MTEIRCSNCGSLNSVKARERIRPDSPKFCSRCSLPLPSFDPAATAKISEITPDRPPPRPKGTLFHPRLILGEGEGSSSSEQFPALDRPPARRPYSDAFLEESISSSRILLCGDRTEFGLDSILRIRVGLEVEDPWFAVEVVGQEFFLKSLSERPLQLNGRKVRHVELRSGDEIRVGESNTLFFRIAEELGPGSGTGNLK